MAQNFIDLEFADGEYRFAFGLEQIDELQAKCKGDGIGLIYSRIIQGAGRGPDNTVILQPTNASFRAEDLYETIRLGLIGGGSGEVNEQEIKVDARLARRLMKNYVYNRPLVEAWQLAASIMLAVISGYTPPEDEAGKMKAAASKTRTDLDPEAES